MSLVATTRAGACSAGMAKALSAAFAASGATDGNPGAAWQVHRDPNGFLLHRPTAWLVQAGPAGEIAVTHPRGTAAAMVRARVVPARADLAQWLQQHYAATEPGLHNVRMLAAESRDRQVAHAAFDYGSNVFQGRASVVAMRDGDCATLYVAAAARAEFAQRLPALVRILDSLRFGRAGARPLRGLTHLLQIGTKVRDRRAVGAPALLPSPPLSLERKTP